MDELESLHILVGVVLRKRKLTRRQETLLCYARRDIPMRKRVAILRQLVRLEAQKKTRTEEWGVAKEETKKRTYKRKKQRNLL